MMLRNIKIKSSVGVFFLTLSNLIANPDTYWQDFENACSRGTVKNIVNYVGDLPKDNTKTVEYKREALCYFLSTGGKYGFREAPATFEETEILTNVAMMIGVLQEIIDPTKPINIVIKRE